MSIDRRSTGFKVALLLRRGPKLDRAEFAARWREACPACGDGAGEGGVGGVFRHIRNIALGSDMPIENASSATFDMVEELLFETAEQAERYFASGRFVGARGHLLGGPIVGLSGEVSTLWHRDGSISDQSVKILTLPVRRVGMSKAAFASHWMDRHAGLALAGPGTRGRLRTLDACPADGRVLVGVEPAPFDGIGTIRFDNREDLEREFSGSYYREVMAPDEPRFTDMTQSVAIMVRELPL